MGYVIPYFPISLPSIFRHVDTVTPYPSDPPPTSGFLGILRSPSTSLGVPSNGSLPFSVPMSPRFEDEVTQYFGTCYDFTFGATAS